MLNFTRPTLIILAFAISAVSGLAGASSCLSAFQNKARNSRFASENRILEERIQRSSYVSERSLEQYLSLMPGFEKELLKLKATPGAVWLNVGGGGLRAELDFLNWQPGRDSSLSLKSVNVRLPKKNHLAEIQKLLQDKKIEAHRFQHFDGRRIREIPFAEIGVVSVITDLFGAFSYSLRPDLELEKYARHLREGDRVYILTGNIKKHFSLRATPLGDEFSSFDEYYPLEISDYLAMIKGFRRVDRRSPPTRDGLFILLERTGEKFYSPRLQLDYLEDGGPPRRGFLVSPPRR